MTLFEALVRHQLYLEGLKLGRSAKFNATMRQIERELRQQLGFVRVENIGDMTKAQLAVFLRDLKEALWKILNPEQAALNEWLQEFIGIDRTLFIELYGKSTSAEREALRRAASASSIWTQARNMPMGANGILAPSFIQASRANIVSTIQNLAAQSYSNSETTADLAKAWFGTPEVKGKDGALSRLERANKAVENTVIQHVSATTNTNVAKQAFEEYEWVSVIDDVTTKICRSRDGKRYKYGEGPLPPAHVNCRSTVLPVGAETGEVDYLDTFAKWARATPDSVLKDIFGDKTPDPSNVKALTLEGFKAKSEFL